LAAFQAQDAASAASDPPDLFRGDELTRNFSGTMKTRMNHLDDGSRPPEDEGEHKNPGASPPGERENLSPIRGMPGRLTRDPSPKYGLSTHFFMLSHTLGDLKH